MTGTVTKVSPRELVSFILPPAKGPGKGDSNKQAAIGRLRDEPPRRVSGIMSGDGDGKRQ